MKKGIQNPPLSEVKCHASPPIHLSEWWDQTHNRGIWGQLNWAPLPIAETENKEKNLNTLDVDKYYREKEAEREDREWWRDGGSVYVI